MDDQPENDNYEQDCARRERASFLRKAENKEARHIIHEKRTVGLRDDKHATE